MKKIISIIIAIVAILFCANNSFAQNRVEVAKGVFVVTYGNVTLIENDNTQQSVQIKVQQKSDNLYDILCGDTVVKTVAKAALTEGITTVIMSYTTIPKWVSRAVVGHIVNKVYNGVCDYYR